MTDRYARNIFVVMLLPIVAFLTAYVIGRQWDELTVYLGGALEATAAVLWFFVWKRTRNGVVS